LKKERISFWIRFLLVASGKTIEVGQPYVKGAKVEAVVLDQIKGEKTTAF